MLELAGELFSKGCRIDFTRLSGTPIGSTSLQTLTNLPEYPFNHTHNHWVKNRVSKDLRHRKHPRHELGTQTSSCNQLGCRWKNVIRTLDNPWIVDHKPNSSILYPVSGLVVMAVEAARPFQDKIFDSMAVEDYRLVLAPKVRGTLNLHARLPQDLSFFIMLSSTGAIIGNIGQANYASACTFRETFARSLWARGQKCVSLGLGLMLRVGYAADNKDVTDSLLAAGHEGITEREFHTMLKFYCNPNHGIDIVKPHAITGLPTPASLRAKGHEDPPLAATSLVQSSSPNRPLL